MIYVLEFHSGARQEYFEISRGLEACRKRFGEQFRHAFRKKINLVLHSPFAGKRYKFGARQFFIKRFRYFVYYFVEAGKIRVITFFHSSRDRHELLNILKSRK